MTMSMALAKKNTVNYKLYIYNIKNYENIQKNKEKESKNNFSFIINRWKLFKKRI